MCRLWLLRFAIRGRRRGAVPPGLPWPVLFLAYLATACGYHQPIHPPVTGALDVILVNRETVQIHGNDSVLDVLRRKVSVFRLGEQAASSREQPLVLIDGRAVVDGVAVLNGMPAFHVESAQVLSRAEAMAAYGGLGVRGAVVITTRRK